VWEGQLGESCLYEQCVSAQEEAVSINGRSHTGLLAGLSSSGRGDLSNVIACEIGAVVSHKVVAVASNVKVTKKER
jgi:hypothetical protein